MELTDRCGTVEFVVRRATVADNELYRNYMAIKIAPFIPKDDRVLDEAAWKFITRVTRTVAIMGIEGWTLPSWQDDGKAIWAAFLAYLDWDDDLAEFWKALVDKANAPRNDQKFVPADQLSPDEKKSGGANEASGENPSSST